MPIMTSLLDNGNFVHSPELPVDSAFSEYLDYADHLLRQWDQAQEDWQQQSFAHGPAMQKEELADAVSALATTYAAEYGLRSVERDPTFLPVSQFFERYHPIQKPFSILHCDLNMSLHTVQEFPDYEGLKSVNAALDEDTPLRWWQPGPHNHTCYLFGHRVWELRQSETKHSEEGIVRLFLEATEKERSRFERLSSARPGTATATCTDFIPEKVRVAVWRRAGGKCAKCGRHEGLEFDYIVPASRGGKCTPENLQMLCNRCYEQKQPVF
jgi:hypothetical protein